MYMFVVALHIVLSLFLVLVIILQPGKGGDVGSAFGGGGGGGGGGGLFGPRGPASFLARATPFIAVSFMVTSITLAWFSNKELLSGSDLDSEIERLEQERLEREGADEGADAAAEPGVGAPTTPPPAAPPADGAEAAPATPPEESSEDVPVEEPMEE